MDSRPPWGTQEEFDPGLTAAEHAELEAETDVLIAKIRRRPERRRPGGDFDDRGNMGVCHADFLASWDGVLLKPPSPSLARRPTRRDWAARRPHHFVEKQPANDYQFPATYQRRSSHSIAKWEIRQAAVPTSLTLAWEVRFSRITAAARSGTRVDDDEQIEPRPRPSIDATLWEDLDADV
jgi:hypothetical protein